MKSIFNQVYAFAIAAAFSGMCVVHAQDYTPPFDDQGTLELPVRKLPRSDLVSPEFREAYLAYLKQQSNWPPLPSPTASKAEWDKFDTAADELLFKPPAIWAEQHYPVTIEEQWIDGVHVAVVTPKGGVDPRNRNRVLLNVHSGGFITGRGLWAAKDEAIPMAGVAKIKVVTIDYRMAPQYRFPAASEDVEKVYRSLLKTYKPQAIGMFGCSAGGTLTAQSVAWFASKGLPRPGAVGIFCSGPVPFNKYGDSAIWVDPRFTAYLPSKPSG